MSPRRREHSDTSAATLIGAGFGVGLVLVAIGTGGLNVSTGWLVGVFGGLAAAGVAVLCVALVGYRNIYGRR